MRFRSVLVGLAPILGLLAVASTAVQAQSVEQSKIRFSLDWAFQGPESPFTLAADKGYYKDEGLDVTVDRGTGSTDTVKRVAAGAYEFGWADLSAMIIYNSKRPDKPLRAVYVTGDYSPLAVITVKGRGINEPKDLEGKSLGMDAGGSSRALFPLFAQAANVNVDKIEIKVVTGPLRESMLARGDVDAVTGFASTGIMNLKDLGLKVEDVITIPYAGYGIKLYGPALVATAEFIEKNPNTVRAMVRAVNRAYKEAITDPRASAASLKSRDPLIKVDTECDRQVYFVKTTTLTDNVKANGISAVDMNALQGSIDAIKAAYELTGDLTAEEVFTDRFLPPGAERMPPPLGSCS